MKRVLLMSTLLLATRLLAAQEVDLDSLMGETWYGLYLNGEKAGYLQHELNRGEDGAILVEEDANFHITMNQVRQDTRIHTVRRYAPDGALQEIEMEVIDPVNTSFFHGRVVGEKLLLNTRVGGQESTVELPRPAESIEDVLYQARLIEGDPRVGDQITFSMFEPMYQKESDGVSQIVGKEQRIFGGVDTTVYKVKTTLSLMGIESSSYIAEDGTVIEDIIADIFVMRVEPEEVAKDVNYSNDVIISNAAHVAEAIENPRTRDKLRLRIDGPLKEDHLFNDGRQTLEAEDGYFVYTGTRASVDGIEPLDLPVTDESVQKWLEPTVFVQSDDPALKKKAAEIAGGEKDAFEAVKKLCAWVNENVRNTFSARLANSLEVLGNLEGDCTEHSMLFIGLCRAAGIPAREVAGLIYVDEQPGFYFHQWAKVWIGEWIDVDPTWNQPLADVTHVKLAEGDLLEQAKLIPIIGRLEVEVLDDEEKVSALRPAEEKPAPTQG